MSRPTKDPVLERKFKRLLTGQEKGYSTHAWEELARVAAEHYGAADLREAFLARLTVSSPHSDRRRKDYNQAIFNPDEGWAIFNGTDLDMVLDAFDAAVKDCAKK